MQSSSCRRTLPAALRRTVGRLLLAGASLFSPALAIAGADLAVHTSHVGYFVQANPAGTFTIEVENTSAADTAVNSGEASLDLNLPAGVTLVSTNDTSGNWSCPGTTCTYNAGIATGAFADPLDVTVAAEASVSGLVNFAPIANFTGTDDNSANNTGSEDILVFDQPVVGVEIEKSIDKATPAASDIVTYTVRVSNESAVPVSGLVIDDELDDSGLTDPATYDSHWTNSGTLDTGSQPYAWTLDTLTPGDRAVLELRIQLPGTAATNDSLDNTASITATGDESKVQDTARSSAASAVVGGADVAVAFSPSDEAPAAGDDLIYSLTVTNHGSNAANNVTVTANLPAGLNFASDASCSACRFYAAGHASGDTFTANDNSDATLGDFAITLVDMAAGEVARLDIPVTVDGAATGVIGFTAQVSALDETDPVSSNDAATATIAVDGVDLALSKGVADPTPGAGSDVPVTYTLSLSNEGARTASGIVTVTDVIPPEIGSLAKGSGTGAWGETGGVGTWTVDLDGIGGLAPGAAVTVDLTGTLTGAVSDGTVVINTAQIATSTQPDPNSANDTASATVAVGGADIAVTKTVSNPVPNPTEQITYTVTVTNNDSDTSAYITVHDHLPTGTTYASTYSSGTCGAETFANGSFDGTSLWTVGTLAPGESACLNLIANVDAGVASGTVLTNRTNGLKAVAVDGATPSNPASPEVVLHDPTPDNNVGEATLVVDGADISLSKSASPGPYYAGNTVTYTLTATNLSDNVASGVQVVEFLPYGLAYDAQSGTGTYDANTGVWDVGTLAASGDTGDAATITIDATITAAVGDSLLNSAWINRGGNGDPDATNDAAIYPNVAEGDSAVTVAPKPDVDVDVTLEVVDAGGSPIADPTIAEGQLVHYRVTVTNHDTGDGNTASDIVVTNDLPSGVTYSGCTDVLGNACSSAGAVAQQVTATVTSLGPDASAIFDIEAQVDDGVAAPGSLTNDVAIAPDTAAQTDIDATGSNSASAPITAVPLIDIGADIRHVGYFVAGAEASFDVVVTNPDNGIASVAGNDATGDFRYTQTLPPGLTVDTLPAGSGWNCSAMTVDPATSSVDCTFSGTVSTAGESAPLSVPVDVATDIDTSSGQLVLNGTINDVTATVVEYGTNVSNAAAETVTLRRTEIPGLTIEKVVDAPTAANGDTITYTVTVRNDSAVTVNDVVVEDILPTGDASTGTVTFSHGYYDAASHQWRTPTAGEKSGDPSLVDLDLNPGEYATLTVPMTVTAAAGAMFTNTATISAVGSYSDAATADNYLSDHGRTDSASVAVGGADISIGFAANDNVPGAGAPVVYSLTITNDGANAASNVVVSANLPVGLTYSSDAACTDCRLQSVDAGSGDLVTADANTDTTLGDFRVTLPTIAAGEQARLDIPVTVAGAGLIDFTAQITSADQADPAPDNNSATATIAVDGVDLSLAKTVANATPAAGTDVPVQYTLTLTNTGDRDATGVVTVTDLIPPEVGTLTQTAGSGTWGEAGGVGTWSVDLDSVGSLAPQASVAITLTGTLTGTVSDGLVVTNTAQIAASAQPDPNTTNDTASATLAVGGTDIAVTKTVSQATPAAGANLSYTIQVTNDGPNSADVVIHDYLPPGVAYSGHLAGTCGNEAFNDPSFVSATAEWTVGTLAAGQSKCLQLHAVVDGGIAAGTVITNRTSGLSSTKADPNSANNSAEASIVVGGADIAITKSVNNPAPYESVGGWSSFITYSITVTHNGGVDMAELAVTDFLPLGVVYDSHSGSGESGAWAQGAPGEWIFTPTDAFSAGESATLDIVTLVAGAPGTPLANAATVRGFASGSSPVGEAQLSNNDSRNTSGLATSVIQGLPRVDIDLDLQAYDAGNGAEIVAPAYSDGNTVYYRVRVTNLGPDTLTEDFDVTYTNPAGASSTVTLNLPSGTLAANASFDVNLGSYTLPVGIAGSQISAQVTLAAVPFSGTIEEELAVDPGNDSDTLAFTATQPVGATTITLRSSGGEVPGPGDASCYAYHLGMAREGTTTIEVNDACWDNIVADAGSDLTVRKQSDPAQVKTLSMMSLAVQRDGPLVIGTDIDVRTGASGTSCSGDTVTVPAQTFAATDSCSGTTSITAGAGVTVANGANVTFEAPTITLLPGFHAEAGSIFHAVTPP